MLMNVYFNVRNGCAVKSTPVKDTLDSIEAIIVQAGYSQTLNTNQVGTCPSSDLF